MLYCLFQGSEPMLSITARPQGSARGYAPGPGQGVAPDIWEGDLAISRAKVYLVGNPSAQAGSSAGMPDLSLEVCQFDYIFLPLPKSSSQYGLRGCDIFLLSLVSFFRFFFSLLLPPCQLLCLHVDVLWTDKNCITSSSASFHHLLLLSSLVSLLLSCSSPGCF